MMIVSVLLCRLHRNGLQRHQQQAAAAGHSLGHELALLTIHGVLHLLGYDHGEPDEEKEMFALQEQLLEQWVAEQVEVYEQDRQEERDRRLLDKSRYFDN